MFKRNVVLTLAIVLVAIITFLIFYYGKMEAEMVRQQIENK